MPVHVLNQTKSLKAIHSVIRHRDTSHSLFVFQANRLIRLILEKCFELLPYRPYEVRTPIGELYEGQQFSKPLCAVSVVRAGESMEYALSSILAGFPIGKILIQRNKVTKLPHLYYAAFPEDIADRYVLLLEPMLATGGSAIMAVRELLERGVPEHNIIFANVLTSPEGLARLESTYPNLTIVTSSVEKRLNEEAFMVPGIGDFGDRYFGTTRQGAAHGQA
ncbi:uracil phosphoribosyltransferase [Chromohalobacter marismortui]|uniref:Uracil phosphoribosyltransferase n=1 Tax=Chromohalobacter marismortui TaxID=42055 RepID=A0A4R7NU82_9GAMM|nr:MULTISPECIES: uracil phosphoribosyltransferase [Chromohalobacter]MCI0509069.1 uracil phosphoribosyltransferase [Chromohalobacter sp.]MCI0592826.1 uracil phosphoribosyltransferase [Chromohalobacter sp.]TDU24040.1 uracil phosphoribosyltransferase [Chromohalobacter marismortui]